MFNADSFLFPFPPQAAFKAALYEEIREIRTQGLNKVEMAARLGIDEEARRLLDPHHPSKLPRIAEILERVGKYIVVGVEDRKEITARVVERNSSQRLVPGTLA
jgi:hypothetical protein